MSTSVPVGPEPEYLDSDGYPTEAALERIKKWDFKDNSGPVDLLEFVRSIWWSADWGFRGPERTTGPIRGKVLRFRLSTGGWSGNESIIGAMLGNAVFWLMCWQQSRRGGHFVFDVPDKERS